MPIANLAQASGAPAFLSAYRDQAGAFGVAALDDAGGVLFTEALPARGHDTVVAPHGSTAITFARRPGRTAITFARRPGRFALVIDLTRQTPAFAFEAAPGRHFYGHGCFSCDGRLLYATENDYEGECGVLGIYDVAAGYARIGEMKTHGIGPHEALLLDDGRTLAVANGGILTHPDFPRQKLNLATMEPSLVYLDSQTGDLMERVSLPSNMHQLSIRHMDQAGDGSIWFGGQNEGAPTDDIALIGRHQRGQEIELIGLPDQTQRALQHYVGSIKISRDGSRVAVTSPRGDAAIIVDTATQNVIRHLPLNDVSGVAEQHLDFALSTGEGFLSFGAQRSYSMQWDNHLRSVAIS